MAMPDRRLPVGDKISEKLLDADEPVPFEELAKEDDVAHVAGWVGNAVDEGLVEDIPGGDGRRRFRLRRRGEVVLTQGRRATDA